MDIENYPISVLPPNELDKFLEHNQNVMIVGEHGCGKTYRVLDCFKRNLTNWLYFSGSTMDPWIDLIGVPVNNGNDTLKFIRPEKVNPDIEAIFVDEFNRAPKEVRNALMEMLQFKAANGVKFPNLRVIWTAINPPKDPDEEDDFEYDVEEIDPAQLDRFHVIVRVPNKPSKKWFRDTHDKEGEAAVTWWNAQSDKFKKECSSRRLDYAVSAYKKGLDIKYILPSSGNIKKLLLYLDSDPDKIVWNELIENPNITNFKALLATKNIELIKKAVHHKKLKSFLDLVPNDIFSDIYFSDKDMRRNINIEYMNIKISKKRASKFDNKRNKFIVSNINLFRKIHKDKSEIKQLEKIIEEAPKVGSLQNKDPNVAMIPHNKIYQCPDFMFSHIGKPSMYVNTQERDNVIRKFSSMSRYRQREKSEYIGLDKIEPDTMKNIIDWLSTFSSYQVGSIKNRKFRQQGIEEINRICSDSFWKLFSEHTKVKNWKNKFEELGFVFPEGSFNTNKRLFTSEIYDSMINKIESNEKTVETSNDDIIVEEIPVASNDDQKKFILPELKP